MGAHCWRTGGALAESDYAVFPATRPSLGGVACFSNLPADSHYQLLIATPTVVVAAALQDKSID